VKYADARSKIKSGDVLAWSHLGWGSWYAIQIQLVRIFTRSEYSHVGIAWCVGERVFVLEAVTAGVRIFPLSKSLPFFLLPWRRLTDDQLVFALDKIAQRYSKIEAIKAFFGVNDKTDLEWQCAEYVASVLGLPCEATPSAVVGYLLENDSSVSEVSA
jgi:hypothetical protein